MVFNNGFWFYSMMGGWSTWQWVVLDSSQFFWSFDTPETPGSVSVVFADNHFENEIWNRLKHFLPVWIWPTDTPNTSQLILPICSKQPKHFGYYWKKPLMSVHSPWSDPLALEGLLQNFGGTLVFPVLPMVTPLVCVCMTLRRACILFSRLLIMFNRTLLRNNIFLETCY